MDINAKNVSLLANFMDGLTHPMFNMRDFFHECGTPACALGWASRVPEFASIVLNDPKNIVKYCESVFGDDAYHHLFNGRVNKHIKTPQQWAEHARAFLKDNGYEVTPPTKSQADQFAAFMDRVLNPVDLGAVHRV